MRCALDKDPFHARRRPRYDMHLLFSDAEPLGDHSAQFVVGSTSFGWGGHLRPDHAGFHPDDRCSAGVGRGSNGQTENLIGAPPPMAREQPARFEACLD